MGQTLRMYSFNCSESIYKQPEHSDGCKGLPVGPTLVFIHYSVLVIVKYILKVFLKKMRYTNFQLCISPYARDIIENMQNCPFFQTHFLTLIIIYFQQMRHYGMDLQ